MDNTESKFENRKYLRILAFVLVIIVIFSMFLGVESRIQFTGSQYVGKIAEYAASVTEDTTGYLTEKRLNRAWAILKSLVKKPKTFEQFETYASIAIAREDYAGAVQYMEGCIETYTGNDSRELAVLFLRLASLNVITGEYEKALLQLNRAAAEDPELASVYFMRAEMRMVQGDLEGAAQDVEKYLEIDGGNPVIMASLGQLYENVGYPDKAAECYAISAENEPAAYVALARCQMLLEDIHAARESLEKFREVSSEDTNGEVSAMYAVCLMNDGEYTAAAEEYRRAVEDGYAAPMLMYEQAMMCSYLAEDYAGAARDGAKAVQAEKEAGEPVAETAIWTGLSFLMVGQYTDAQNYFRTALYEDPDREGLVYYLGVCAMSLNEAEKAEALFTESIERGESITACAYNRALCRIALGKEEEAIDDLYLVIDRDDEPDLVSEAWDLLYEI